MTRWWRRLRGWGHRLWHHPLDDYRRLRADLPLTAPKAKPAPAYQRSSGIPPCGPGSCRRKALPGRVHCSRHAAAHTRRLRDRRRRKARRKALQRSRRR